MTTPPSNPDPSILNRQDLESFWRAISTSSLDGFWVNGLDGTILHVNDAYCRMSGYSQDELLQMTIADVEAIESPADVLAHTQKILARGYDRFETRHRTKDGRLIDLEVSLRIVPEHDVIIAFLRDITPTKTVERQLLNALAFRDNLLNTANVLIIGLDVEGRVTFCNPFAARVTGYPLDRLIGCNWFALMVPRERFPQVHAEFERLIQGGIPRQFENPILTRDGEERFISWSNNEIYEEGKVVGTLSFGIDITEKKKTFEDLLAAQQRYADLVETAQDLIWSCDLAGRFTYLNPAVESMLGFEPDELVGRSFEEITPADRLEPDRRAFADYLASDTEMLNYESARLTKTGDRVELLISATSMRDPDTGKISGMQGTAKDITERKHIEEALRHSEAYQRQIIAKAPFGAHFYTLTRDGQLLFEGANPAAGTMLTIDHRPLIGKPILEAFPGLAGTPIPEIYARLAREGGEYHQDQVDYDAGEIRGAFDILAFQTAPGHMAVFFNDITARKQDELELVRAREEALQANRAKDDFLSVVSHELRTPLTPILGFTEMLSLLCETSEQRDYLGHIAEAGQRMLRLVEDILNFSHLNSKPPTLQPSPFFPDSFFRRELKKAAHLAKGNRLELSLPDGERFVPPPEGLALVTDQKLLSQVLHNLIGNACKFTDQGIISLRYGVAGNDFRQATLIFEVEDTGVGIPAEHLSSIWEPFSQVDSSAQRPFEGAGLGLAICRRLVGHLGGDVEVESTPGVGSCFRVTLPVALQPIAPAGDEKPATDRTPRLSQAPRILVIEDNDMNRLTFETQLKLIGSEVVLAVDGEDALDQVRIHGPKSFDLILLDLHLPGMGGLDLCDQLQKTYGSDALPPIVAVSADVSERSHRESTRYGVKSFLDKPVSLRSLYETLEACLGTLPKKIR